MKPKIIAHRGHSQKYPENTLIAFRKAVELGADGIELDVHLTKDKQLIVHHYYPLGHTNNGEGYVFDKTVSELESLDAGSWFSPEFKNEKIPLLSEVFGQSKDTTHYEVEMKDFGKDQVESALTLVKHYDLLPRVHFTSYQYPLLSYLKQKEPEAIVGFISPRIPEWMEDYVARKYIWSHLLEGIIDVIHAPIALLDQPFVDQLHEMELQVHAGLCDTKEDLRKAKELGVDELTTNDLELAIKVIRNVQLREDKS